MAVPPCFRLADTVLPRVRSEVARRLVADGWSQTRAALSLGISQAMVSKYVAAPAAAQDPLVLRLAEELREEILHPASAAGPSAWCSTLRVTQDRSGGDEALHDLLDAERLLRQDPPLRMVPQIGINLARALPESASVDEVLAFPGRIVEAGGRLVSPAPPTFGGSGHLARCLLHLRRSDPAVFAVASVRGGADVRKALTGEVADIQHRGADTDAEAGFRRAADGHPKARAFHDAGGHGIEPCLYLAGPDARGLAAQIFRLHARLVKT